MEEDDITHYQDAPEHHQLAASTLTQLSGLSTLVPLTLDDLDDALTWVLTRLSECEEWEYFRQDG